MSDRKKGLFVTGTDTGVGKSVAAAWLVRALQGCYWKPVQSGLTEESDSAVVQRLSGVAAAAILPETYRLHAPLSPHASARLDGVEIRMESFIRPDVTGPLVVEGAGGVLVPLNATCKMVDLMVRLRLPVVVVARTALGTINHTLLTLEALRARQLEVAGVILSGPPNAGNRDAILEFGAVAILAEIPWLDPLTPEHLARIAPWDPVAWARLLEQVGGP
ncbi:MAG: dethiobiotin synthase [Magnetococcales bacterium]|nr:dethiobiotin synthase [Magnetococcales bacterium]